MLIIAAVAIGAMLAIAALNACGDDDNAPAKPDANVADTGSDAVCYPT